MKIDFVTSKLAGGGAERVMAILANHFANKGHEVSLISFNDGDAYPIDKKINRVRLHKGLLSNHKLRAFNALLKYYRTKSNRPNVIIAFITLVNLISIVAAKLYSIPVIVSEHNSHLRAQEPKFLTKFTRDYIYRYANFVTVLTAFDIDFYKKKKANVVVMPNPCTFIPLAENDHLRTKTILAVGDLDRYNHKGFDNLIHLIAPILQKFTDWELSIIGSGGQGEQFLKSLVVKHGITEKVNFLGFRNNVNEYMQEASIYLLSSRYEGLPMVLLEAMSQGMACIAYDCKTGPADLIAHNVNGLLIKDQDIHHMQTGLTKLIENEMLRGQLSNSAIESIAKFSIDAIAQKWENLFKTL